MGCPGLLAASALPAQPGAPCCARRSKSASGAKRCSAWPAPWTREASDCGACLFRLHACRAARACIPGGRPAVCDAGAPVIHERGAAAPPEAAGPRRAVPYTLRHAWSPAPQGAQDQGLLEEAEQHCLRLLGYVPYQTLHETLPPGAQDQGLLEEAAAGSCWTTYPTRPC